MSEDMENKTKQYKEIWDCQMRSGRLGIIIHYIVDYKLLYLYRGMKEISERTMWIYREETYQMG